MIVNKEVQVQLGFLETEKRALRHCLKLKEQEYETLWREIRNHVYESLSEAEYFLTHHLKNLAVRDCQGAGNCGKTAYSQDFIVHGVKYTATMTFQYNAHNKVYFYIEESEYSYTQK